MMKKRGFVLVCVLWVLAILTVVTIGFGRRAVLDRRAAFYSLDHTQALMLARGAVHRGMVELRMKGLIDQLLAAQGVASMYLGQPWSLPIPVSKEAGIFKLGENFENDNVTCTIVDLERFIDINTAPEDLLAGVKSLSRTTIRKIMARRTGNEEDTAGPSAFHALEELRVLGGVDEDAWYGDDGFPPLDRLLTIWGDGAINVNTASQSVLKCIPNVNPKFIEQIISFRAGGDGVLGTSDDQGLSPTMDTSRYGINKGDFSALQNYCKFTSSFFKITGVATFRNETVRAMCSAVIDAEGNVLDWREESIGS